ncbi:hypothetical protein ACFQHN_09295 [Natrialbaceae archaeon GCM10025896]
MHAVSFSEPRTGGPTSDDSVTAFTFGFNTIKLTARGPNWSMPTDWNADQSVRDRPPYYPLASGHGHPS